ncbi:hypothetical protein J6590_081276 [Homalodisca vitripennis]|nr:hypothetical protein J6590_081276 [Homalodisca vitripennis]
MNINRLVVGTDHGRDLPMTDIFQRSKSARNRSSQAPLAVNNQVILNAGSWQLLLKTETSEGGTKKLYLTTAEDFQKTSALCG